LRKKANNLDISDSCAIGATGIAGTCDALLGKGPGFTGASSVNITPTGASTIVGWGVKKTGFCQ
jgi:hypothetical protein